MKLVSWAWRCMKPDAEPLTAAENGEYCGQLMASCDDNDDGVMTFAEFAPWFSTCCETIQAARAAL